MESQFQDEQEQAREPSGGHLVVMGINYHSTPLFVREKLVIPEACLTYALSALAQMPHVKEAVLLSTCNRTEAYAVVSDVQAGLQEIESFFLTSQRVDGHGALKPNFKLLHDDVALHLFRVASGLDSLVLGEGQIMAQVKAAHRKALDAGTAGPLLGQLFQSALACGKRVRSETSLGRKAVSISSAAVELARECCSTLSERRALIIGAGQMAQICAKFLLADGGAQEVVMLNRSRKRLEEFAANNLPNKERLNLSRDFEDRHELITESDIVIVATAAQDPIITKEELCRHALKQNVCIIDISVPHNVEPSVSQLAGVSLFLTDDLSCVVSKNLAERESLTSEAEKIVFECLGDFNAWERSLLVAPTIAEFRKKIEAIRAEHLMKHERKNQRKHDKSKTARDEEFEELSRALINQILHHPTTQLKSTSDYAVLAEQAEALRTLFNLDRLSKNGRLAKRAHKATESALKRT